MGKNAATVVLPVTLPVVFIAVITNAHDVPANEVKVAVPADELDGVTTLPLMVYVVVTEVPVPPDHVTVNPLDVTADEIILVIGVGTPIMLVFPVVLPDAFVAVITNAHDVPVNEENVAVPVDELDGVTALPLMVYVLVTEPPVPPDQETVNPLYVMADGVIFVMGVGITYTVALPITLPDAFVAVMTNGHDCAAVNDVNVAVPTDEEDGLTVLPLIVYVVVTDVPVPPDHVTVKPVVIIADGAMFIIADGNASTVTLPTVPLPDAFVGVITSAHDVPNPVNEVNVAVPVDELDGVTVVPLMVYVVVTDVLVPPDQETVNPVDVIADGAILVTGVGSARTVVVVPTALPVALVAVITKGQDVPVNDANVAVPVDELDGVAVLPLMVYVVVTDVPVPPNQVTVNPVVVIAEGVILVTGVGNASTVTFPTTLPVVFGVVITNAQDAPNPVNNVNVAVPVDELDGVAAVPLMVYTEVLVNSPIPPDQVTVNPLVVIADVATLVMGDNV